MIPACRKCAVPMTLLGRASTDEPGEDEQTQQAIATMYDRGVSGAWDVYECQNEACGCRCRAYRGVN